MLKKNVSLEQLRLMPERVLLAEKTNATIHLTDILYDIKYNTKYNTSKILVVGAGGSYPAALLIKQILAKEIRSPEIEASTPQSAIRILQQFDYISNCKFKPHYDAVIAISYSGKTPDIQNVYKVCKSKNIYFILITNAKPIDMQNLYSDESCKIISYYNENDTTENERGMISMASTLAPIMIFDNIGGNSTLANQDLFKIGQQFVEQLDIKNIANSIKENPIINVFYDYETIPTAFDIESKFVEAGLANVVLHENKNFSHGRFVSFYTLKSGLNINLLKLSGSNSKNLKLDDENIFFKTEYDKKLNKFLGDISNKTNTPYIKIGSAAFLPHQWNIEAITKLPYLLVNIGVELGIDVSKPLNFLEWRIFFANATKYIVF